MTEETGLKKRDEDVAVRFMHAVVKEFSDEVGFDIALTNFQKRLAQNYFIAVDQALVKAEQKRQWKKKGQDPLPVVWANVDMQQLALDVVSAARVGLDPAQPNHISMVPYKNNNTNKYDIGFLDGYRGIELKAIKYGLDVPHVTVELVHANDIFKPVKRDQKNRVESYIFEVPKPFGRGEVIGGFYYHAYADPTKNKLVVMPLEEILKRKPDYAAPEFWGGEKTIWKDGKPAGKEKVEGWYQQMCYKTVYRAAFRDITIDSQKIDDDYLRLKRSEEAYDNSDIEADVAKEANQVIIDLELTEPEPEPEPEKLPEPEPEKAQKSRKTAKKEEKEPEKAQKAKNVPEGPDF